MPAQRKYPEELRERAVKMVFEVRDQDGKGRGELARVARQLGVHPEALDALDMAIWSRREHMGDDLVHHSDRGVQYTSICYTGRLEDIGPLGREQGRFL
jgi:hypothetical protein